MQCLVCSVGIRGWIRRLCFGWNLHRRVRCRPIFKPCCAAKRRAVEKGSGRPAEEERIEEEGVVGTIPIGVEAEMKIEPSVWASGKAESSGPGEKTGAMPGNERIPRPRA